MPCARSTRRWVSGTSVAHALALRAMDQLGVLLAALLPSDRAAHRSGGAARVWACWWRRGRLPGAPRYPSPGTVTSDSLAVLAAGRDRGRRSDPAQAGGRRAGALAVATIRRWRGSAPSELDDLQAAGQRARGRRLPVRGCAPHRGGGGGPGARRGRHADRRRLSACRRAARPPPPPPAGVELGRPLAAPTDRRAHADHVGRRPASARPAAAAPPRQTGRRPGACGRSGRPARPDSQPYRPRPSLTKVSTSAPAIPVRCTSAGSHPGASAGGSSASASA